MKRIRYMVGVILLATITLAADTVAFEWVRVKWVADGDTIILQDGRHVRYIGIDAPEVAHRDQPGEPLGDDARTQNQHLVDGWRLRLVPGEQQTDHYGRFLADVYRSDGLLVNAELVRRGFAHVLYQKPNTGSMRTLLDNQREAMKNGLGIWQRIDKDEIPHQPYLGNRSTKRFHDHACPMGRRMARKNQIRLKNKWEAFWEGYAPARECVAFP